MSGWSICCSPEGLSGCDSLPFRLLKSHCAPQIHLARELRKPNLPSSGASSTRNHSDRSRRRWFCECEANYVDLPMAFIRRLHTISHAIEMLHETKRHKTKYIQHGQLHSLQNLTTSLLRRAWVIRVKTYSSLRYCSFRGPSCTFDLQEKTNLHDHLVDIIQLIDSQQPATSHYASNLSLIEAASEAALIVTPSSTPRF